LTKKSLSSVDIVPLIPLVLRRNVVKRNVLWEMHHFKHYLSIRGFSVEII
jgi:hypothetical protein